MSLHLKHFHLAAVVAILIQSLPVLHGTNSNEQYSPTVEVFFSPKGGATDACITAIGAARTIIYVQAYSFTSAPIAKALVEAHQRGVSVAVILDRSQRSQQYSSADFLARAGIRTLIDSEHSIAHDKVMILDGKTVITGSFNFTKAAEERNAENLLIMRDEKLAARYVENWEKHRTHSESYDAIEKPAVSSAR